MVEIEKPRIECVENPGDGSYGKYVVEPLERGYGTTLGNSLRRILLSSLPGTAVTSIKIAGVQHEFSTIPGVKEDVTEIVLNVKSIIAKLHSEGVKTVYNHADYRLMSKRALQQLARFRERNLFLRGLVPLIGYQTTCVYYNRSKRWAGESKYPLKKMLDFAIDGITSFSVKPVRMIFWLGCVFILIGIGVTIWTLYTHYIHDTVPGWASLIISIWLVGGFILAALGIVGEYIGKIYIEVKDRPRYNIERTLMRKDA